MIQEKRSYFITRLIREGGFVVFFLAL